MEIKYEKYDRVPCCRARKLFSHESSELMSLFVLGGRVPMKSAQAAQKVALSISSGLIAYLSGRGNWCHPSILNHPLRRLMKYLLKALFYQLTTGLLMSRMGGPKKDTLMHTAKCSKETLCSKNIYSARTQWLFIFYLCLRRTKSIPIWAGGNPFMLRHFARWKSIFKLFAIIYPPSSNPHRMYPWAHLFPIIPNVRDLSGEAEHNHPICTELQSNSGRTFHFDRMWLKFEDKNDSIWIINCSIYAHFHGHWQLAWVVRGF